MAFASLRLTIALAMSTLSGEVSAGNVDLSLQRVDDDNVQVSLGYCADGSSVPCIPTDRAARRCVVPVTAAATVDEILDSVVSHLDTVLGPGVVVKP